MTRSILVRSVAVVCLVLGAVSCGRSSEQRQREHVARGDGYIGQKQYQEAIVEYRNAVRLNEGDGTTRYKLARAYEASGDARGALREFIRAADLLPDNVDAQMKAATYLLLAGRFEDAQTRADRVLERDPNHVDARILRANALVGVRDLDGALAQIEEAIAIDPERATSYTNLAQVKLAQGKRDEAGATLEQAVALDPKSIPALLALANFQWGVGDGAKAEQTLRRVLENDPQQVLAHRALATLYLTTDRAAAAEPHLKRVADASPAANGRFALADYYVSMRRPDDARRVLTPLVGDRRSYAGAQARLAELEYVAGVRSQAHAMIDEVLTREPNNANVLMTKARWLLREGKAAEARRYASSAVEADRNSAGAHYLLGTIQERQQDLDAAGNSFREVLRLNPRAVPAQLALSQLELRRGRPASAAQLATGVLERSPNNPAARLNIARALTAQGDFARAESEVRGLVSEYPKVAVVHAAAGSLRLAQRQIAEARQSFERALQLDPTSIEALSGLVRADILAKRPAAARARVEAQMASHPDKPELLLLSARVYMAVGDAAQAERAALRAVQVAPASLEAYGVLAGVYLGQGKLDAARVKFDEIARREPRNVTARTIAAVIVEQQDNLQDAKKRYAEIVEIDANAAVAANNLAWIYAEEKSDLDRALQLAQRAVRLIPDSAAAQDTLGWVYHQQELPSLAVAPLLKSVELAPNDAGFNYHLGLVYLKTGDRDKARAALQRALALDSASPRAAAVQKALASLGG